MPSRVRGAVAGGETSKQRATPRPPRARIETRRDAGDDNSRLVGDAAKNQAAQNPTNTIYDAKRLIGRKFSDKSVAEDASHFSFKVVPDAQGKPQVEAQVKGAAKRFSPEEVSAMVLGKMKETAEASATARFSFEYSVTPRPGRG